MNEKISNHQLFTLTFLFNTGSAILFIPGILVGEAKQDAWISAILAMIVSFILVLFYDSIALQMKNESFYQFTKRIMGKWIGNIILCLFIVYFYFICSLLLRSIGDFTVSQIMPETPIEAIYIPFMLTVVLGARLGIETLSRAAEIFLPWILGLLIMLLLLILPDINMDNIKPVFENGSKVIIRAAIPYIGFPFLELVAFLMIFPYLNDQKKRKKVFLLGTIGAGLSLFLVTLLSILVLGADFTARNIYPSYILAKKISVGEVIQRIEVIMAIIWFLTMYFKTTILFFVTSKGLSEIIGLKDFRVTLFPLAMILIVLSLIIGENIIELGDFTAKIWPLYALTFGFFLPLILLVVSKVKMKG